ncbi:MAG: tetratricopeptide repeat protein [Chlorobi bacterium]|nr:tetratricopeptide repeat protein [Chlorobiota bacterium]
MTIKEKINYPKPKAARYIVLMFCSFLFLYLKIAAQQNNDSLHQVLYLDTTRSIAEKLVASHELSLYFADKDISKSIYCDRASYYFNMQLGQKTEAKNIISQIWQKQSRACDYKSADTSLKLLLQLQDEEKIKDELPDTYYNIGLNCYNYSDYEQSKKYFEQAKQLYEQTGDKPGIAKSMKGIAIVVSNWGDYEKAIGLLQNAREIYSDIQDESGLAGIYVSLGVIMQEWDKLDRALDYFNQALQYYNMTNDIQNRINALLHIGDIYLQQGKYKLSIQTNRKAQTLESKEVNKRLRSIALSNIGEAFYKTDEQDSALAYQKKSLKMKLEVGDNKRIAISYSILGDIYLKMLELDSSETYLKKALLLSRKINFNDYELKALKSLSELNKKKNNYFQAYNYLSEFQELNEITFNDKTNKILEELDIKYESGKKETENKILKQKNEIQHLQIEQEKNSRVFTMIFATFIVFIAFALVFFINYRIRLSRKNYSILAYKNKEITRQKEELSSLNKDLEESREKFKGIVENATIGIYQTNIEGEILFANKYLMKTLGYDNFDQLKKIDLNSSYENRGKFLDLINKKGIITGREDKWTKADGSEMYVIESAWVVRQNGKIKYIEGLVEDVTKRKKAELDLFKSQKELKRSNKALKLKNIQVEAAIKEAESANKAKSSFLANVSHEIRTPMNSIIGFTELLLKMEENPKRRSYISAIDSSSKSLLTLINDILDLSKIQAGKLNLVYETVALTTIISELEQIFSMQFKSKGLKFTVNNENLERNYIKIDGVRLRQLLFNLVGNALKFTAKGEVRICFSTKLTGTKTVKLEITVSDTGPGIPIKYQKQIFSAFSQGSIVSRDHKGSGLGLAISKQLVELMKGGLKLDSKVGKGSKFTVSIPDIETIKINKNTSRETAEDISKSHQVNYNENAVLLHLVDMESISKELRLKAKNEFSDIFIKISNNKMMNDIESFSDDFYKFAVSEKSDALIKTATDLISAISKFDIDEIELLLSKLNVLFY